MAQASRRPKLFGILNVTEDSFSDGGRYLAPPAAIAHAEMLRASGADVIDVGAASSHPDAAVIGPELEIARLSTVVPPLLRDGLAVSVDSFELEVQRWALKQRVAWLNDIHGFGAPALYDELAVSTCGLVVMHSVQSAGNASRTEVTPNDIMERMFRFFDKRLEALDQAGIDRGRLVLDPGMGFFLSTNPQTSLEVLRKIPVLKARYGLPILVSVSRKSFIRALADRPVDMAGPATLAAELYAAAQGADIIRTHDPGALADALTVMEALA